MSDLPLFEYDNNALAGIEAKVGRVLGRLERDIRASDDPMAHAVTIGEVAQAIRRLRDPATEADAAAWLSAWLEANDPERMN